MTIVLLNEKTSESKIRVCLLSNKKTQTTLKPTFQAGAGLKINVKLFCFCFVAGVGPSNGFALKPTLYLPNPPKSTILPSPKCCWSLPVKAVTTPRTSAGEKALSLLISSKIWSKSTTPRDTWCIIYWVSAVFCGFFLRTIR